MLSFDGFLDPTGITFGVKFIDPSYQILLTNHGYAHYSTTEVVPVTSGFTGEIK
jgi:hypothetical protein